MARGGHIELTLNRREFEKNMEASLSRVERGTRKATVAACEEIKAMTLREVPRDTNTLAESFFYEIHGKGRNFTATLGYAGEGHDKFNPKGEQMASDYMIQVHEDLEAHHPTGKAKFLEDPITAYHDTYAIRASLIIKKELEG